MPDKWAPLKGDFITGDVIRWTEADWDGPDTSGRRRKKKTKTPWGKHCVTAQVLKLDSKGFVRLRVIDDEIIANTHGLPLKVRKKGEEITKKSGTIRKGSPERMQWSDESARALAVSRFLKADGI